MVCRMTYVGQIGAEDENVVLIGQVRLVGWRHPMVGIVVKSRRQGLRRLLLLTAVTSKEVKSESPWNDQINRGTSTSNTSKLPASLDQSSTDHSDVNKCTAKRLHHRHSYLELHGHSATARSHQMRRHGRHSTSSRTAAQPGIVVGTGAADTTDTHRPADRTLGNVATA